MDDQQDAWVLGFDGWDPGDEGRREALCTLGNGRFATRGAHPESRADGVHYPGTYAAGVYNRLCDEIAGRVVETESVVNLPNWLDLRIAAEDGPWVGLAEAEVVRQRVELDLRRGVLSRWLTVRDAADRRTSVQQRRFVDMARPHLAALHTVITAENWSGRLRVASGIDGAVTNAGVARYRSMAGRHLDVTEARETGDDTVLLVMRTTRSAVEVAVAARTRVDGATAAIGSEPGRIGHEFSCELESGGSVAVEKVVALVTSRDVAISRPADTALDQLGAAAGFEELRAAHETAWAQLWRRFRLELTDGVGTLPAPEAMRVLRTSAFHLLQRGSTSARWPAAST